MLAVSGGADSMAMLHCLQRLREQGAMRAEFIVGHVNHKLRGAAANDDQQFVEDYAARQDLKVISRVVDVPAFAQARKLSVETAGRMLRIRMLAEMARRCGAAAVATAHQRDDQAETLIFRLMRGTSFRGLCGIRPSSELEGMKFIRPMLGVRRQRILAYCREENLPWRQDHTNVDCGFARNRIRRRLLPHLQAQARSDIVETAAALAEKCRRLLDQADAVIDRRMPEILHAEGPDVIVLKKAILPDFPPIVLGEILRRCLVELGIGLRDYTAQHYQRIMHCIYHAERMKRQLPGRAECIVDEQFVCLRKPSAEEISFPDEPVRLEADTACRFGPFEITASMLEGDSVSLERSKKEKDGWTEWLDADRISGPIRVRARRPGDRFRPLGMKAEKKVGKFLTAAKVSPVLKDKVFILEDSEKILWVAPIRICEEAKVTGQTRRILQIQVIQQPAGSGASVDPTGKRNS